MNEIISYFLKSISNSSESLKKKSILVEKPWALVDDDGAIQKLIFKKDGGLVLSKNGQVTEGSWEYFPEARALLVNRGTDKLLLSEQFIDDNVLIFKRDGTNNEFFSFANELTVADYDIPRYLNSLRCKQFGIRVERLITGNLIHISNGASVKELFWLNGLPVEQLDQNYNKVPLEDGKYLTADKKKIFYIAKNRISKVSTVTLCSLKNGKAIEIEHDLNSPPGIKESLKVTMDGKYIQDQRLVTRKNVIFEIKESRIAKIIFPIVYELSNGWKIKIEQRDYYKIKKGDKIVEAEPIFPIPNGSYRIKDRFSKIKIVDNTIV